ncbi:NRPS protein [Apiospora phragmitis]|uniref:NRPS protein n=1 Tax=Apiospora phragmitis TaxID=2905665 RepID=A0ABR1X7K2_9PEZI
MAPLNIPVFIKSWPRPPSCGLASSTASWALFRWLCGLLHVGRSPKSLRQFLPREKSTPIGFGATLARATIVESKLVLTVHRALADYPTQEAFLEDVACVYNGAQAKPRGSYKLFVEYYLSIDDDGGRSFWASRFSGQSAVFPPAKPGYIADATVKINKALAITPLTYGVAIAQVPSYIELALALTLASYTKADSVTFGCVNLKPLSTLRDLLEERKRESCEVAKSPSLQYGLQRIRAVSEAARAASEFNTILDVRPMKPVDGDGNDDASYSGIMRSDGEYKPHGSYCLTLVCFFEGTAFRSRPCSTGRWCATNKCTAFCGNLNMS